MLQSAGEPHSNRLGEWATNRAWRATGGDLVLLGLLVGWPAGVADQRGFIGILGGAIGLVLVLTGMTVLSSSRQRSRMLTRASALRQPPGLPETRLPLLVSSIVAGAGLLLAVLALATVRRA